MFGPALMTEVATMQMVETISSSSVQLRMWCKFPMWFFFFFHLCLIMLIEHNLLTRKLWGHSKLNFTILVGSNIGVEWHCRALVTQMWFYFFVPQLGWQGKWEKKCKITGNWRWSKYATSEVFTSLNKLNICAHWPLGSSICRPSFQSKTTKLYAIIKYL